MIRDSAIVSCNDALLVRRPNCLPYSFETQRRGGSEGIRCLTSSETSWDRLIVHERPILSDLLLPHSHATEIGTSD
jgi:hypothetical protein